MPDDDDADSESAFGTPLPPEDRLWRHPSEMQGEGAKQQIILVSKAANSAGHTALVAMIAGLIGAAATIAFALGTNTFVRETPGATSLEKLNVNPPVHPNEKELTIANSVLPSIARVEAEGPNGVVSATAVVFRSDGYLITTADTVNAADRITVFLDGQRFEGAENVRLVGKSTDADIAVLWVNRTDLPVAIGSKEKPSIWARTIIIDASPVIRGPAVDAGLVTNDVAEASQGEAKPMYGLVQVTTRASVTARARGSVFVDESGTVIGLVTSRAEPPLEPDDAEAVGVSPDNTGGTVPGTIVREIVATGNALHFAIPGDFAWDIATQIVDQGKVIKSWLGISRGDQVKASQISLDGVGGGMKIAHFEVDSPAQLKGMRVGDVIIRVDSDTVITSFNDWAAALRRHRPGSQIHITYVRDGTIDDVLVTVGGRPELP